MAIPEKEPSEFTAGDTVKWKKSLTDYPASDGWVLSYAVRGASVINVTSVASGDVHAVTISAETSGGYVAGDYWWQSYVSKDAERYKIGEGSLAIKPDFASVAGVLDNRSHVKKTLDALEATIQGKASLDQMAYSINGRSLSRLSPADLLKWRNEYLSQYRAEQQAERQKQGLSSGNKILVRFREC